MSDFTNDPKISVIKALLKQAESAAKLGNQAEADTYNEKASALIAKYGVDQALLAEKGQIKDALISRRITIPDNYAMDKRVLLHRIVIALGAKVIFLTIKKPGTAQSYSYVGHVFAFESDMERIQFLFDLLSTQMVLGAAAANVPLWENARSYRKSWMLGFADAINARLKRHVKQASTDSGTGTDLVLFNRSSAVEKAYKTAYPKTHTSGRSLQGTGRSDGYAAGQRASLGTNNIGGSRVALGR